MRTPTLAMTQDGRPYKTVARSRVNVGEFRVLRAFSHLRRQGTFASGTIFWRLGRVDVAGNLIVAAKARSIFSRKTTVTVFQHPDHPVTKTRAQEVINAVKQDIAGPVAGVQTRAAQLN